MACAKGPCEGPPAWWASSLLVGTGSPPWVPEVQDRHQDCCRQEPREEPFGGFGLPHVLERLEDGSARCSDDEVQRAPDQRRDSTRREEDPQGYAKAARDDRRRDAQTRDQATRNDDDRPVSSQPALRPFQTTFVEVEEAAKASQHPAVAPRQQIEERRPAEDGRHDRKQDLSSAEHRSWCVDNAVTEMDDEQVARYRKPDPRFFEREQDEERGDAVAGNKESGDMLKSSQ